LESAFDPEVSPRGGSLFRLIVSDYLAYYGPPTPMRKKWGVFGSSKADSPRRLALLFVPRLLNNPCLHATVLLRLALRSPTFMLGFWRTLLIAKHSIDIQREIEIGPGLLLVHPFGIGLGARLHIGSNVTILNSVSIGGNVIVGANAVQPGRSNKLSPMLSPTIGDNVVVFADSFLVGPITVGERAVIGAGAWVDHDVPPRAIHPGRAALFRQLAAG
jgi:serine O-acetyltransferase